MKLGEVVDLLMKHYDEKQGVFAKRVGATGQSMVSRMRGGDDWELHWNIIIRVLSLCQEAGINPHAETTAKAKTWTAQEVEDHLVALLVRLLQQEKPRPKQEFLKIVERAYERARKHKTFPDIPSAITPLPVKNTSR